MLFQLVHEHSADQNHHPAAFRTQRRSCLHIAQLRLMRDGRLWWENSLYQVPLLLNQSGFVWFVHLISAISFLRMKVGSFDFIKISLSVFLRLWVWLHCFCLSRFCSCHLLSQCWSSSSPFIFVMVFLIWLGDEWRRTKAKNLFPVPRAHQRSLICHFPLLISCSLTLSLHFHILLCLLPLLPIIIALGLSPPAAPQCSRKLILSFRHCCSMVSSLSRTGGGRSLHSCSWLVRMRLFSSAPYLFLIVLPSSRADCWTPVLKGFFLRLNLPIDGKKEINYACWSQAYLLADFLKLSFF